MKIHSMKFIFWSIIFVLLAIASSLFFTNWDKDTKTLILQYFTLCVTALGFYIAIQQLIKRRKHYLEILIDIKTSKPFYSIKTQVLNKSGDNKDISFAFLLITKQNSNIIYCANKVLNHLKANIKFNCSNDFVHFLNIINEPFFLENQIGIIPLDFFYSENIQIGNESPAYTFTFNNDTICLENDIYSVRFFVFPKDGYHRSTVESLIII
jgi:uncharacterized protein YxeA